MILLHRDRYVWSLMGIILATPSYAGPEYIEPGDAGSSKATAADASMVIGSGHINGALNGAIIRGIPDFEDMYIINITTPGRWQASTSPVVGGGTGAADFNSVLWLFDFETESGLLANDNVFSGQIGARLRNFSTDGTPININTPGLYLLAVSVRGRFPVNQFGQPLFIFGSATEVSGPDGSTLPRVQWLGTPDTPFPGEYIIEVRVPRCPGDVDNNNVVNLADLSQILLQWGMSVPPGTGADVSGNGLVDLADIAQVIANWSVTCP